MVHVLFQAKFHFRAADCDFIAIPKKDLVNARTIDQNTVGGVHIRNLITHLVDLDGGVPSRNRLILNQDGVALHRANGRDIVDQV